MEDQQIIELFWARNEDAISETSVKYGDLCYFIAGHILARQEDREECVSDTYLGVWNAIPTQRPRHFSAFISRITRNLALKKQEYLSAARRNPSLVSSLDELEDCISGRECVESILENRRIEEAIDRFLAGLSREKRNIFLWRYWYFISIADICQRTGYSQSKVKSMLYRLREDLRSYLEKEGIDL